jgi:hypothetical protein
VKFRLKLAAGVAALGMAGIGTAAIAHDRSRLDTFLHGYEEVPAVSTNGFGSFKASINRAEDEIDWTLTYGGTFNGTVTQAHVHLGQKAVNGGISVFFCTNLGNGPATAPPQACPPAVPGERVTIKGTWKAADVVGPAGQGIAAGELGELIRAMRAGVTYANIHSTTQPGGEIRGQVDEDGRGRDRDH